MAEEHHKMKVENASNQSSASSSSAKQTAGSSVQPVRQRRPANGFLGFCHRHRLIVSRKNKKIENRLVTKILGNWWATLTDEQKAPYEERARQFKESFLAANPGFKWYTPRESTGNTPVTRQSNRRGRKLESCALSTSSAITPGKLADESQMGGLNSLMQPTADLCKKRSVACIASEHDYLKPPIDNNNTIMAGEELPSTNVAPCCQHPIEDKVDLAVDDEAEKFEEEGKASDEKVVSTSSKKRKTMKPKKNSSALGCDSNVPSYLSFTEFMKVCPVYQYEVYLQKKDEINKNMKKALAKRRKRQALAQKRVSSGDSSADEPGTTIRRRRKGRSVRLQPTKTKKQKTTTACADSTTDDQTIEPVISSTSDDVRSTEAVTSSTNDDDRAIEQKVPSSTSTALQRGSLMELFLNHKSDQHTVTAWVYRTSDAELESTTANQSLHTGLELLLTAAETLDKKNSEKKDFQ